MNDLTKDPLQNELPLGFLDVVRSVEDEADLGQREHAHHERVVPQLLVVLGEVRDVLEAALLRPRHVVHNPFRPGVQMDVVVRRPLLMQVSRGEQRRHRIDVLCTQTSIQWRPLATRRRDEGFTLVVPTSNLSLNHLSAMSRAR